MQTITDRDVIIASYCRTPLGRFMGSLKDISCTDLGAHAIKGALKSASWIKKEDIGEVVMGNVHSANLGQAPARQAALKAGLPDSVPCTTVNKVCASGMKAIMIGALLIMSGRRNVVCTGGMESLSQVPHYIPQMRTGKRMGDTKVIEGILRDGLIDVYSQLHMAQCAEKSHAEYNITREAQDDYSHRSCQRVIDNQSNIADEISPLGKISRDEYTISDRQKLSKLKPIFEGGTITAGSAPGLADGAACVILCSGAYFKKHQPKVDSVIIIRNFDDAAHNSVQISTSPALVIRKILGDLKPKDIDYWEINEAFASVAMINQKIFDIDVDRLNVFGGSLGIGHPFGCTGARIIVTLCNVLNKKRGKRGIAALCNGGGGASGILLERLELQLKSSL